MRELKQKVINALENLEYYDIVNENCESLEAELIADAVLSVFMEICEICEEASGLKWAKAEAVKEFAERLKEKLKEECSPRVYSFFEELIDNLVKEMTVEENDY